MSQLSFADNGPEPLKPWQGGEPITPHSEPTTSKEAAYSVQNGAANLRGAVLEHLLKAGEATQEEVSLALELSGDTVRPRLWELCGNGNHPKLIEKTDNKRKTSSGRSARTYRAL